MLRKFFNILFIILISLFQVSFINTQRFPLNQINIILVFLVLLVFNNSKYSIYFLMISSMALELYSNYPYGLIFISFALTFFLIRWLSIEFFTNKSIYSSAMIFMIGIAFFNIILNGINEIFYRMNLTVFTFVKNGQYFSAFMSNIFLNLVIFIIASMFYNMFRIKMKTVFILE
ncbi:MAG: hypothetical protein V1655_03085 [bacterium]